MRIDPNPMGCEKVSRGAGSSTTAPTRPQFAMTVENAHAPARSIRSGGRCSGPHSRAKAEFSDIDVPDPIDKVLTRPGHVRPFGKILPVRREKLKAAVFAVSQVHS